MACVSPRARLGESLGRTRDRRPRFGWLHLRQVPAREVLGLCLLPRAPGILDPVAVRACAKRPRFERPPPREDGGRLTRRPMMRSRSFGSSSGALRTTSPRSASSSTASASTRSASGYLHWLAGHHGVEITNLSAADEVANTPFD